MRRGGQPRGERLGEGARLSWRGWDDDASGALRQKETGPPIEIRLEAPP
jgi:hypothetical protein